MTIRSAGYDHPAYLARMQHAFPALAAGASGATSKFVAFTNLQLLSVTAATVAAGSSTSTATLWNGTNTVTAVSADTFSLIRVTNTTLPSNGTSGAPALATTTYGPFVNAPYNGTSTGTQTGVAGLVNNVQVSYGGTATTGQLQVGSSTYQTGGIVVQQGDQIYIQRGTDASAVTGFALEFAVQPLANVSF